MISFHKKITNARIHLYNAFFPEETIEESKKKWTFFAEKDPEYCVVTDKTICTNQEKFRESGRRVYQRYVVNDAQIQQRLKHKERGGGERERGGGAHLTSVAAQEELLNFLGKILIKFMERTLLQK